MKKLSTLLLATLFAPLILLAQNKPEFLNFKQGTLEGDAFTTNNFKCIAVGKGNVIWAGTQYGGLYMYSDSFKIWRKSEQLTNVFINDIKADADSGIWIAQSGIQSPGNNSNIAGGINYFPVASDNVNSMEFYSVTGTTTGANILSRNVRSLYLDPAYKKDLGRLPRPWVAQGTFITSNKTSKGGVSIGLNPYIPYFNNIEEGFASGPNATPICEAIGGGNGEVWAAVRQNNGKSQILRYDATGKYLGAYTGGTDTLLPTGFTAQAIFFDPFGNRWIGLKSGGLVIKTPAGWVKMDIESKIPPGTQINYNAIAGDEYGNVYIGTSSGLLEYLSPDYYSFSSPDNPNSYNLYTDIDGLPSNNITGIAYDKKNGKILITSSGGVTFMNKREPFIKGVVYDVFTSIDSANAYAGLQRKPLSSGVTVRLLKDGVEEEFVYPETDGMFELKEAEDGKSYTVEVKFVKDGKEMKYLYDNIRNHTLMLPTLIPDSLIGEIKAFKPKMLKRCFPIQLSFGIKSSVCTDGFDLEGYDLAYDLFYASEGIRTDHKKKVDNLANYYASLATVYSLGGNATDLTNDLLANAVAAIESLKAFGKFSFSLKEKAEEVPDQFEKVGIDVDAQLTLAKEGFKNLKDLFTFGIGKVSSSLTAYPAAKTVLDNAVICFNDAADLMLSIIENGKEQSIDNLISDNLRKVLYLSAAASFYENYYCLTRHKNFVYQASNSSKYAVSKFTYTETFDNLFNPSANSIAKYGKDTLDNRKASIDLLSKASKYFETGATVLDAASTLALVPGGQIVGVLAKALSSAVKFVNTTALAGAMYLGAIGSYEEMLLSDQISEKAGLLRNAGSPYNREMNPPSQNLPDTLLARKNSYNQKLKELQAIYNAPVYNASVYGAKYKEFIKEDSLYSDEMAKTLNALSASTDSAIILVPGFQSKFNRVIDSFVTQQYTIRHALYYQNLGYIFDTTKAGYTEELNNLANQIIVLNDSAISGITSLVNAINANGIAAPAFLVQDGYKLNHNHVPGSTGSVTYTFKNYGTVTQNNVSFKISKPTEGFVITSTDFINVGSFQPGESKQISFSFVAPPSTDSFTMGRYQIDVNADNGSFKDITGSLYIFNAEGALPVTLSQFDATCTSTGTKLTWQTSSEVNSGYFEIEKSNDGTKWTSVSTIKAAGSSNIKRDYSFTDANGGNTLYRLKQVDKDGSFTYSSIESANCGSKQAGVTIYPVPATNAMNVIVRTDKNSAATIVLIDVSGRVVRQLNTALKKGTNNITLQVAGLSSGQYFLRVVGSEIFKTQKVTIKQ